MPKTPETQLIAGVAQLLGAMLVISALYVAQEVFIPLALAVLLSFLLSPIVNRIQRIGIGNVGSVLITASVAFVLLAGCLTLVGRELTNLIVEVPKYKEELVTKARGFAGLQTGLRGKLDELAEEVTEAMEDASQEVKQPEASEDASQQSAPKVDESQAPEKTTSSNVDNKTPAAPADSDDGGPENLNAFQRVAASFFRDKPTEETVHDGRTAKTPLYTVPVNPTAAPLQSWAGTVGNILGPLGTAGLVTVFVLFLLVYRDDMRDRIIKVISRGNYVVTTEALHEVSNRISQYLLAQSVVNVSYGLILSIGLFLIGRGMAPDGIFPNFILWGVLATLLRFVPYVGPVISAIFPVALSLAVFPGYAVALAVVTLIVVMELISNNVLEPWLYGASTGLSAVAVIFAAVFWGWLWGPVGLLLSTPLTVCLVVLGRHVPRFQVFSTMLGEEILIHPSLRFYQRLLGDDQHKATEMLTTFAEENGAIATIDRVIAPTLRRMRNDTEEERLSAKESGELTNQVEAILTEFKWPVEDDATEESASEEAPTADEETQPELTVVGFASHHASESLILQSFASANRNVQFTLIDSSTLPDQAALKASELSPDVVLVSVLPPGGFVQARFLCRSIRKQRFDGIILVCCHGKFRHFDRLFVKFRKAGATFMTTSAEQTSLKLKSITKSKSNSALPKLGAEIA